MPTSIPTLIPGTFYHIYNRGNNRENIFFQERNYAYFLTEKIGFIIPMTPGMVNGLFVMSFLLLAGRWWLGRSSAMIRPY